MKYTLVSNEGDITITVWPKGASLPLIAHNTHPNFKKIKELVEKNDPAALELFDIATQATKEFRKLTELIAVENGEVLYDGEVIDNAATKKIIEFIEEGKEDWSPIAKFFEKVMSNPQEHSRKQLYEWLSRRKFTITQDGDIVAYKKVKRATEKDKYFSITAGPAITDGKRHEKGPVPQGLGSVVEMKRSDVDMDPKVACSRGLHVGTWDFAFAFSSGGAGSVVLRVIVNPRDVVSVPNDSGYAKVRCVRYKVLHEQNTKPKDDSFLKL